MEADFRSAGRDKPVPYALRRFVLRLVIVRANVKADEVRADGGYIDLHDSKSIVEPLDLRGEFVTQASYLLSQLLPQASYAPSQLLPHASHVPSQLLPQLCSHLIHLAAKAMDVVTEA